jgi:hypothetical protein
MVLSGFGDPPQKFTLGPSESTGGFNRSGLSRDLPVPFLRVRRSKCRHKQKVNLLAPELFS